MSVQELSLFGRKGAPVSGQVVGELSCEDIAALSSERGTAAKPLQRIRDRHHTAARLVAQGMENAQIAAITGYDPARISIFKSDPTFRDLVEHYRRVENSLEADFAQRAESIALTAMNILQDRLEDTPDEFAPAVLLEVTKVLADRAGHAPIQQSFNVNANVGTAAKLSEARERLRRFREAPVGGDAADGQ